MKRQRGVAVVTALLLTTLAVTIVASLFWQQQVQVRSMENQRLHLQTQWILRGALDFARLILRQDANDRPLATTLDAPWATPVAETRLDQYIERERLEGENYDATLSGLIQDAQARYNLANLAQNRKINEDQVKVFERLLANVRLDPSLARRTALQMRRSQQPPLGAEPDPDGAQAGLELSSVDDLLAVPGFTPEALSRLRELVVLLPQPTAVNINTAGPEVLAALMNVSVSEATAWTERRKSAYWRTAADFQAQVGKQVAQNVSINTISEYFLVTSRIRLERATLNAVSLIERKMGPSNPTLPTQVLWTRQI
ncbi:type II secretion system minor pseudopilin GspK [Massilia sp. TS11]|uniref:type II secretion system minor pseudopilin GspK n=1 Tax=Massilia sp. TS11 TaxID=2908003 RepID=UPI001ED9D0E6|nr:type II secretion system minor pseudopilin GspK [Massilia sp. TS11]MCG2585860.1 type II secretion system minor pseudopilin GspK [Massilia sp. TS11]